MEMTASQCRAARALLGWSQKRLVRESGVSKGTLLHFEKGHTNPVRANLKVLQTALESAGVEFTNDGGKAGVALRADATAEAG